MDQSDKFWEEQEKEMREAIRKAALDQRPLTSCGTIRIRAAMEKKKQAEREDGHFLIQTPEGAAAGLSALTSSLTDIKYTKFNPSN